MDTMYNRLSRLISTWWFYLLFLLVYFLPSYTALPFDPQNTPELIGLVLSNPLIYAYPQIMPLFKFIPVVLVAALLLYGKRAGPWFLVYAALLIAAMAILQNTAFTEKYGLAVLTGNIIVYIVVALVWFLELLQRKTDFSQPTRSLWRYWVVPVALLAFWFPVSEATLGPEFSVANLVSNSAGLTTCMMLPLFLAILSLYHPRVNRITLRISSYAGLITGLLNVLQWFILTEHWWIGVVHLPLLTIASYTFWLSFIKISPRK